MAITPSVGDLSAERCYGCGKFNSFGDISRPLKAMARCLELNGHFLGRKMFCAHAKFGSDWSGIKVIFVAFLSGSIVQSSFPFYFS